MNIDVENCAEELGSAKYIGNWEKSENEGIIDVPPEEDLGVRKPIKVADPKLPTQTEIDEHNLTHLPCRNWCKHCIRGKERSADHRVESRPDGMAEIHMDYCFMNTADRNVKHTIVVAREKFSRMTLATEVPMKGASVEFPARRILAFVKELGMETTPLVLKPDQEQAIVSVIKSIMEKRSSQTFKEFSPVEASQSNGVVESHPERSRPDENLERRSRDEVGGDSVHRPSGRRALIPGVLAY